VDKKFASGDVPLRDLLGQARTGALQRAVDPEYLLLDGHQRTTSLYLALRSGRAVPTRDSRKNPMERRYFADIGRCIHPDADREEAIRSVRLTGPSGRSGAR
jgi:hypothetical protein